MVELNGFNFSYALSAKDEPALKNVDLKIIPGEFLTLCGASGSGKSTLLRNLKQSVAPAGKRSGFISVCENGETAIVFQNPETQLIMSDVISDLAFQPENKGMPQRLMKKRMSETVSLFGIEHLLHKKPEDLSGGQKQIVALCAALMCEPKLLLLDEPISQLDPLSASAFLNAVKNLNSEFGVTIVMAEHRLDECAAITDRIAFMDGGEIKFIGETREALRFLYENSCADYIPSLPMLSLALDKEVALTAKEFRKSYSEIKVKEISVQKKQFEGKARIKLSEVTAGYGKKNSPVLNGLDFTAGRGIIVCVAGGNGSGKSTLLKTIAGIIKPFTGKVKTDGKIAYLPQNARDLFLFDTVRKNIKDMSIIEGLRSDLNIVPLLEKNPADLSGGEQQKCALAIMLSRSPDIMLLDEPTKGMDPQAKRILGEVLQKFSLQGGTVVISTHDIEFAALWADECVMLFDGEIAYRGTPREFFTGSKYCTTAVHKALGHINPLVMVLEDVV